MTQTYCIGPDGRDDALVPCHIIVDSENNEFMKAWPPYGENRNWTVIVGSIDAIDTLHLKLEELPEGAFEHIAFVAKGPTFTKALALARRGWHVLIYEQRRFERSVRLRYYPR